MSHSCQKPKPQPWTGLFVTIASGAAPAAVGKSTAAFDAMIPKRAQSADVGPLILRHLKNSKLVTEVNEGRWWETAETNEVSVVAF